jgi:two-component system KDP operon response regulator KdpE
LKTFNILVVDDDQRIIDFLSLRLKSEGYAVLTAANGVQAIEQTRAHKPDLIILDLNMPVMDGLETMRELRIFSTVPVIMLTARSEDDDIVLGLRRGADDYLSKPFNPDELVARIEAIRRRMELLETSAFSTGVFIHGNVTIDFSNRMLIVDGSEKPLTRIEWLLLNELEQNAGRFMSYEEILGRVWGSQYRGDVQMLRTWVSRLRGKLGERNKDPQIILTIPGCGYIISPHEG